MLTSKFYKKFMLLSLLIAASLFVCYGGYAAERQKGIYLPTSAWLVGESQIFKEGETVIQRKPCTIVQQYNNGYLLRFTGTDTRLKVMAIDFRKDVFYPGEFYKLQVQVSPSYVEEVVTKALNASTILVNMENELKGFAETLKDEQYLRLQFRSRFQTFSLNGIERGLSRMAQCYRNIQINDSYNLQLPPRN